MKTPKSVLQSVLAGALVSATLLLSVDAQASPIIGQDYTFSFSFSPIANIDTSGAGAFVAMFEGGDTYAVQSITGAIFNAPVAPSSQTINSLSFYAGADNNLFFPDQPYVDFGGLSFDTGYDQYNIYSNNGVYGFLDAANDSVGYPNSAVIAFNVTQTPLPPAALLLAGGTGLLGFFGARKRRKNGRLMATQIAA